MTATVQYFDVIKSKVSGWMVQPKMEQFEWYLAELAAQEKVTVVEIGVWYGMSAVGLGMAAKHLNLPATIYAVDAWTKEASSEGINSPENKTWWDAQNYSYALHSFNESLQFFDLKGMFNIIIGKSEDVVSEIPDGIDLLHIDGNHSEEKSMKDIELYLPKVKQGGIICLDDTSWPTLAKAVEYMNATCELLFEYNVDGASFNFYRKK